MGSIPTIRIFFSSPGDVKMERETAKRIVDRLQGEIGDRMVLEPYFWEHEVMVATKDYQENIPEMDGFDIVVCVLWSRLGTPLHPNRHPRPGGGFFESGTEYEFFTAMQAHNLRGTPDIFVFRNNTEPRRPSRPKEAREAVDREVDRLDHFFEKYFQEEQYFTSAINVYSTLGEFEEKLSLALHSFLEGRLPRITAATVRTAKYEGQPYLGLSAFDFKDAPVFFGRTAQVGEVVESFQTQELDALANEGKGRRFVMIIGSSGSGKSSLARAGVLPMLIKPGVIEGAQVWRRVIFKPSDGTDPFTAFAAALLATDALPELSSAASAKEIADLFKSNSSGAEILLRQAFAQAAALAKTEEEHRIRENIRQFEGAGREEDARVLSQKLANLQPPAVRLAVLADQLEELFTTGISDEVVSAFIDRLHSLSTNGRVFVLGTLRSDFYPRCLEHPKLVELMRDSGTYALPAPCPNDLAQMIRQPAAAAGLAFEENPSTGEKLDDLLRDSAIKDPAALPLLSYTLEQLYERRTEDGVMTLAAYKDLGGLEGAIGRRAESVFTSLSDEAKGAFDQVWRQLITLSENNQPVRRRTGYDALTAAPGAPKLVDGLISARLLTVDQSSGGDRTVSVAHEALLRHWPRLVSWVDGNIDFLRARSRLAARLSEWLDHRSTDDFLIPAGPALGEAESILSKHAAALDPREVDYIRKSSALARRHEQARLRRASLIATGALVLSALAVAGGIFAFIQRGIAEKERVAAVGQKVIAEEQKGIAEDAAKASLASQVRASYLLGIEKLESGESREGLTYLANTLSLDPAHTGARDRLYSYSLYGLPKAIPIRSVAALPGARQRISGAQKGPEQKVVYLNANTSEIFDLNTRQVVHGAWEKEPDCLASVIGTDSKNLLFVRNDVTTSIYNIGTGKEGAELPMPKDFTQIIGNSDGQLISDGSADGTVRIRRSSDGNVVATWNQKGPVYYSAETRDGDFLFSSQEELCFFERSESKVVARRTDPEYFFGDIRAAAGADVMVIYRYPREEGKGTSNIQFLDSRTLEPIENARILEASEGLWDIQINEYGTAVGVATPGHTAVIHHRDDAAKDREFRFETYPTKIRFTPDGRLFITATPDGTVRIFDADTTRLAFEPITQDARLEELGISWDGRYLLTATSRHARIWDLAVGPALTLPIVCPEGTQYACRSSKPDHFWIADSKGIQEWDLRKLETTGAAIHHDPKVHDVLMDRDGLNAALLWDSKNIRFVRTDQPEKKSLADWQAPEDVQYWALSDDGKFFSTIAGQTLHFVDPSNGKPLGEPIKLRSATTDNRFVGNKLFCYVLPSELNQWGKSDVRLHDVGNMKDVPLIQKEAVVYFVKGSRDGRWLAASAKSTGMSVEIYTILWDLSSPDSPPRTLPHQDEIQEIAFSPDGKLIAIGGRDHSVQVWNTASGQRAARPLFDRFGAVNTIVFSPDSRMLATVSVEGTTSSVRAWDWQEACPVSQPFEYTTIATEPVFSDDSRTLIFQRPADTEGKKVLFSVIELSPPADLGADMVTLAEGATALRIGKDGLAETVDPFERWNSLRTVAPDSWFFQHPASRPVSPAIGASSLRWIEEDAVTIDNLSAAMPAVGLARASTAYWNRVRYNSRNEALSKMEKGSEAYRNEELALGQMLARIQSLVLFAERNANGDPQVCLYLSRDARANGQSARAKRFIEQGLAMAPDDPKLVLEAYYVADLLKDNATTLTYLKKLRQLEPDVVIHQTRLGYLLWRTGMAADAKQEFTAVVDSPDLGKDDRACILGLLGRGKESLVAYQEIAGASRDEKTGAYNTAGMVYMITGNHYAGDMDEAVGWYRKLVASAPGAADASIIEGTDLNPEFKTALKKVLAATLARHPELAPKRD